MLRLLVLLCPLVLAAGEAKPGLEILTEKSKDGLPGMKKQPPWAVGRNADIAKHLPFIDAFGQYRHATWPGKVATVADFAAQRAEEERDLAANPPPKGRTPWGGWADGPRLKATGRFRVERHQGRWWWVDPEGALFFSFAVNAVSRNWLSPVARDGRERWFADAPWLTDERAKVAPFLTGSGERQVFDFFAWNRFLKFAGEAQAGIDLDHRRLDSWGFTAIGNSSDLATTSAKRHAYTIRIPGRGPMIAGGLEHSGQIPDPFAPEFAANLAADAAALPVANDPWCLGVYVGNELHWGITPRDLGAAVAASPATQPAKLALREFLKTRHGGDIAKLNAAWGTSYADWDVWLAASDAKPDPFEWDPKRRKRADALPGSDADLIAFSAVVAEQHFTLARAAVKKLDPALNYLGCRFNGWAWTGYAAIAAKHCDVVSANLYFTDITKPKYLPADFSGPFMSTEFHFGHADRVLPRGGLLTVADAKAQAAALRRYALSALANRNCIGIDWYQWADQPGCGRTDGENLQIGFVDITDRPHPEMIAASRALGAELYQHASAVKKP